MLLYSMRWRMKAAWNTLPVSSHQGDSGSRYLGGSRFVD